MSFKIYLMQEQSWYNLFLVKILIVDYYVYEMIGNLSINLRVVILIYFFDLNNTLGELKNE